MDLIKKCTKMIIALMMVCLVATGMALVVSQAVHAQAEGPTISTDNTDYEPGENVTISGTGFQPGESVLVTAQGDTNGTQLKSEVVADENGGFSATLELPYVYEANYVLTAAGVTSGQVAQTSFADSVTVKIPSSPVTLHPNDTQTYTVLVTGVGGLPVDKAVVNWNEGTTGGTMDPTTSKTGTDGRASSTLTAGSSSGTYHVGAKVGSDKASQDYYIVLACTAPSITDQPDDATVTVGASVTFSVTASGTTPLSYQWRKGSDNISGATGSSYTILSVVMANAGSYDVVVSNACGTVTSNAATLTVNPACTAPSISVHPVSATKTVGQSVTFSVTATGTAPLSYQWRKDGGNVGTNSNSYTISAVAVSNAGDYDVVVSNSCGSATSNAATLTVNKTTPVITWGSPADIVYGTALSGTQLNATASVPGTFDYTPATGTVLKAGNSQPLSVNFTPEDTANYNNASKNVTIDVTPKPVTPGITADNKVYDGTKAAVIATRTLTGVIEGDDVSLTGGTAIFDNENVGNDKTVTATGLSLTGADAGNYTLSSTSATTTADITARTLTVMATASNKVYDGNSNATVTLSDDRVAGDVLIVSYTSATFADKNVGTGKTVNVSGISISGTDAGNYMLAATTATTTGVITARPITVTAGASSKVYDGLLTSPGVPTITSGSLLAGDTAPAWVETYDSKNVGTTHVMTVTPASVNDGNGGANYTVTYNTIATGVITARPITVTAGASDKVYDGLLTSPGVPTITSGTLAAGDTAPAWVETYDSKNVGTTHVMTVTPAPVNDGNGGANYTVTYNTIATGVITARPITVTAGAKTKVYGADDPELTYTVTGSLANGDSWSGALTRAAGENVGTYAIQRGTLAVNDGNGGNNYTLTYVGANLTITKAPTTATVNVLPNPQQYSDKVNFRASLTPAAINGTAPATGVTFKVGSQVMGTASLSVASGMLQASLSNVALLETVAGQMAPGSRDVTAEFTGVNPNFTVTNPIATPALTINKEDARATYTGLLFTTTATPTSNTATVTLSATIKDITAVSGDPAYDANGGDIRKATVTFVNRDTNQNIATAPVGLVSAADTKTGTATYNWSVNIGSANSQIYTIGIIVNGYYTRNSADDNTVVTVSKPLTDSFITGGGYLVLSNSSGLKAGGVGTKNNFGFNVKYNMSNKNLQGNINTIIRRTENGVLRMYQVKGNSMTSLAVNPATATATFIGKANIQDVTNPLAPVGVDGNATLQVTMTDKGEPGKSDTIGITVWNKSGGLWFSSNWNGTKTVEQVLGGGNLVVH